MSKYSKRQWKQLKELKKQSYRSQKSDNRIFCRQAGRQKYLYESERKAQVALKFNREIGNKRYYVCDSCMGYHTTSKEAWY